MAAATRLLIVEDDADVRDSMAEYLASHGFEVDTAEGGDAMRAVLARNVPDLVLLDLKLPGEDGLALARSLRERHELPIIMVTAADSVVDRVVGLEVGADDYIAKPFDLRELLARVKSVLRRARPGPGAAAAAGKTVRVGSCSLDLGAHRLLDAAGAEVPLTSMEFDLLRVFVEHPNRVLSRDQLLNLTRNRDWEPFDRSVDIRIARLRRKLGEDPDQPRLIKTVRGAGYCYVPAA
ncbi:MAG TPA: response regulator [Burkholderiales bacterium]|nr:response regulator [Burkholderiales bacterium]